MPARLTDEEIDAEFYAMLGQEIPLTIVSFRVATRRIEALVAERERQRAATLAEHLGCAPRIVSGTSKSIPGCGAEIAYAIRGAGDDKEGA